MPQRQCYSKGKLFISQPNHSQPQKVVIFSVVMNPTSLLGFRHFPLTGLDHLKKFSWPKLEVSALEGPASLLSLICPHNLTSSNVSCYSLNILNKIPEAQHGSHLLIAL